MQHGSRFAPNFARVRTILVTSYVNTTISVNQK